MSKRVQDQLQKSSTWQKRPGQFEILQENKQVQKIIKQCRKPFRQKEKSAEMHLKLLSARNLPLTFSLIR